MSFCYVNWKALQLEGKHGRYVRSTSVSQPFFFICLRCGIWIMVSQLLTLQMLQVSQSQFFVITIVLISYNNRCAFR